MKTLKNFGFKNKSGIIMPISALPSPYGIGSFGKPCYDFIDFLRKSGQKCWQVLPLNPTSYGDSPYQSPSTFAGNPYFIDLDILVSKKLLKKSEIINLKMQSNKVDYGWLFNTRYEILRKAFKNFTPNESYNKFLRNNKKWLDSYALFMALKIKYNYKPWWEWDNKDKVYKTAIKNLKQLNNDVNFFKFLQYEFFEEWSSVLNYAHKNSIVIIGDLPIYVARDSVDVWSNTEEFLLDENLNPTVVAGVPPDAYSADGQLWGNPIYNYKKMQEKDFSWWIYRFKHSKKLYDIVRIDHFRAFSGYYTIDFNESSAINGKWEVGYGKQIFDTLFKKCKTVKIIAEDLGFITSDVFELLNYTNFPGMKVLQFAFYEENSIYLPKNYKSSNCVVYTATHDSETSLEWLSKLDENSYKRFKNSIIKNNRYSSVYSLIALALSSKANLALITMQDYLELGKGARINTPSTSEGNWTWRVSKNYLNKRNINKILSINTKYKRVNK